MTDPIPTRAEVEALEKRLRSKTPNMIAGHAAMEQAADMIQALRERAEAAEAERKAADFRLVDRYRNPKTGIFNFPDDVAAIVRALDAARRAEAAAWEAGFAAAKDEIEDRINNTDYAMNYHAPLTAYIRALRRAAPTGGEA